MPAAGRPRRTTVSRPAGLTLKRWQERFASEINRRIDRAFVNQTGTWPTKRDHDYVLVCLMDDLRELGDEPLVPMEELQTWIDASVNGLLKLKRMFRGWKP